MLIRPAPGMTPPQVDTTDYPRVARDAESVKHYINFNEPSIFPANRPAPTEILVYLVDVNGDSYYPNM